MMIQDEYLLIISLISVLWIVIFIYSIILNDLITVSFLFAFFLISFFIFLIIMNQFNIYYLESYFAYFGNAIFSLTSVFQLLFFIGIFLGCFIFIKIIVITFL
jgi:hypothetical protein